MKTKTIAETSGTISKTKSIQPDVSPELFKAMVNALKEADALSTIVIRGNSPDVVKLAAALNLSRSLSDIQRKYRINITER